jgi:hypothetical protein
VKRLLLILTLLSGCESANPKPNHYPPEPPQPYVSGCRPPVLLLCGDRPNFSAMRGTDCFTHVLGEGYRYVCENGTAVPTNHGCGFKCP